MLPRKKIDLNRFKKTTQGLIECAVLIEQAEPTHREKIMAQIQVQDPELLSRALRKVVYFEELIYLDELVLAEILANVPPKVLAFALKEMSPEFRKHVLRFLSHRELKQTIDEGEKAAQTTSPAHILGAQKQILKIARSLEAKGRFAFEVTGCPRFQPKKKVAR